MANYETKNMMSKQQLRKTYKTKETYYFIFFWTHAKPWESMIFMQILRTPEALRRRQSNQCLRKGVLATSAPNGVFVAIRKWVAGGMWEEGSEPELP